MTEKPSKPDTDLRDRPPRAGSPLRAILTGLTVDVGGSVLTGALLTIVYSASLAASGMSSDDITEALKNLPPTSAVAILGILAGSCWSVAGGYVCARIVQRDEYRVGSVMAWMSVFLGLLLGGADEPGDMLVLTSLTTIACVLLGVMYGVAANRRREGPAT